MTHCGIPQCFSSQRQFDLWTAAAKGSDFTGSGYCADCAVEASKAVQAGGEIEKAKMSIGQYGHIALVTDTEGNMIGLHSM